MTRTSKADELAIHACSQCTRSACCPLLWANSFDAPVASNSRGRLAAALGLLAEVCIVFTLAISEEQHLLFLDSMRERLKQTRSTDFCRFRTNESPGWTKSRRCFASLRVIQLARFANHAERNWCR
jgi:hypothetical protein